MKISVEEKHIKTGTAGSCFSCPVALAVREATGAKDVWVGSHIRVNGRLYAVSDAVLDFIRIFDDLEEGYPFSFYLDS